MFEINQSIPKLFVLLYIGVAHTDEQLLMFGSKFLPPVPPRPDDVKVSQMLIDMWTSFASEGYYSCYASTNILYHLICSSRVPKSDLAPEWLPMKKYQTRYLNIDTNPKLINEKMPFSNRLPFWTRL